MNSRDPWATIITDRYGDIIHPRPHYGHPFYTEVPSWIHYGDRGGSTSRQLFEGAFVSGEPFDNSGANMTNILGAELTALSAPGAAFGRYAYPYGSYGSFGPYGYGRFGYGPILGADAPIIVPAPGPSSEIPPGVEPTIIPAPGTSTLAERRGLTAEVGPLLAPATGGILVRKHLDDKQVLHVEICVDGKCHSSSMDLAPAIAMLMQKLATWHDSMHAPKPPPSTVVSTVGAAVAEAENLIVGALVARHIDTIAAGILGDIAGAVTGAVKGIAGGVASTFKKFRGPIGAAAGIAAAAGASAIPGVGPIAAPIAAKLANDLVQSAAGNPAAQKQVAQAAQQAQTDPAVAVALEQATKAVANSTAAHHVQDTAKKAARGDAASQQQIAQVTTDAEKGDPAAKAVADLVANAMKSEWGAKLWEQVTGRGPGTISTIPTGTPTAAGWYDIVGQWYDIVGGEVVVVGSFWSKVKNGLLTVTLTKATNQFIKDNKLEPYVKLAATAVVTAYGGPAAGAAAGALSGPIMSLGVEDKQQADAAQKSVEGVKGMAQQTDPALAPAVDIAKAAVDQTATAYQVSQMVKDAKAGNPGAQKALADLHAAASRGDQNAAAALQAAEVLDRALGRGQEQQNAPAPPVGQWYDIADTVIRMAGTTSTSVGCPPYGAAIGGWYDIVGAAIDDTREKARAHAVTKPGTAAGVLITTEGQLHGRGFRNLDDAISWLDHITRNRGSFTYAAAYEKDASGAAYIQAEEMGGTSRPATPTPTPIPRDAPATTGWW